MRVLVSGSRSWSNQSVVWDVLTGLYSTQSCGWLTVTADPFIVIQGGAKGADRAAKLWVDDCPLHGEVVDLKDYDPLTYAESHMPVARLDFPADWNTWGKKAGFIRNQRMLVEGKPNTVWAFVDKPLPASRGTSMMCKIAREAGVPVYVVQQLT